MRSDQASHLPRMRLKLHRAIRGRDRDAPATRRAPGWQGLAADLVDVVATRPIRADRGRDRVDIVDDGFLAVLADSVDAEHGYHRTRVRYHSRVAWNLSKWRAADPGAGQGSTGGVHAGVFGSSSFNLAGRKTFRILRASRKRGTSNTAATIMRTRSSSAKIPPRWNVRRKKPIG